jgi:mono/diheme cytochrome c family protein
VARAGTLDSCASTTVAAHTRVVSRFRPRFSRRGLLAALALAVVVFGLAQLVPYRVTNPSARAEPAWDSPRTRQLVVAACFDCHSNESHPYGFERVAPLSWWIANHVKEGRAALNFSECTRTTTTKRGDDDPADAVREGSMPPGYFTWFGLHSGARLSSAERSELAAGLDATLAGWRCGDGGG